MTGALRSATGDRMNHQRQADQPGTAEKIKTDATEDPQASGDRSAEGHQTEILERQVAERTRALVSANARLQAQVRESERAVHLQATLYAATFQHAGLGLAGTPEDTTVAYLVTRGGDLKHALLLPPPKPEAADHES